MKIHLIYRCSDFNDGAGPMILNDKVPAFRSLRAAKKYIDKQPGVMGTKAKWSEQEFGNWQIRTIEVK